MDGLYGRDAQEFTMHGWRDSTREPLALSGIASQNRDRYRLHDRHEPGNRMKVTCRTTQLLAAFCVVVSLGGCEQPMPSSGPAGSGQFGETGEPVMIETDAASYTLGARVTLRLVNRTGRLVRSDICRSKLETLGDDNLWRSVRESLGEDCKSGPLTLAPGQAVVSTFTAGPHLPAGRYRIRATLLGPNVTPYEVRSGMFTLVSRDSSG
jgi:hypothetical protein